MELWKINSRFGSNVGWGHSGRASQGGLAFSFVDPGTEVLICAELSRLSDPETHANHDI